MIVVIQKIMCAKEISIETYVMVLICSRQRLKAKREAVRLKVDDAITVKLDQFEIGRII